MKAFKKLRHHTTHKAHFHLLDRINWYKKWHDFKYHHHVHLGLLLFMLFSVILSVFTFPRIAFAGLTEQTKAISSEAEFNQGTLTDTKTNGNQLELEPDVMDSLSNSGGGTWQHRRPITIDNTGGETLIDYQVELDSEKDLVGHWNFDEASGTTAFDSSRNGNNGTVNGATRIASKEGFGNALSFNGSGNNVNFGNNESLRIQDGSLSVSFWFKTTKGVTNYRQIIGHGNCCFFGHV